MLRLNNCVIYPGETTVSLPPSATIVGAYAWGDDVMISFLENPDDFRPTEDRTFLCETIGGMMFITEHHQLKLIGEYFGPHSAPYYIFERVPVGSI